MESRGGDKYGVNGGFVDNSFIITVMMADLVFCFFNFRPRSKAKCFAGDDVRSIVESIKDAIVE